jgi:hypothetical protein
MLLRSLPKSESSFTLEKFGNWNWPLNDQAIILELLQSTRGLEEFSFAKTSYHKNKKKSSKYILKSVWRIPKDEGTLFIKYSIGPTITN